MHIKVLFKQSLFCQMILISLICYSPIGLQTSLLGDIIWYTSVHFVSASLAGTTVQTVTTPMTTPQPSRSVRSQIKMSIPIRELSLLKVLDNMAARHPQASATGKCDCELCEHVRSICHYATKRLIPKNPTKFKFQVRFFFFAFSK